MSDHSSPKRASEEKLQAGIPVCNCPQCYAVKGGDTPDTNILVHLRKNTSETGWLHLLSIMSQMLLIETGEIPIQDMCK